MAFSELGGATSRRGSKSVSAYSGGNGFGLMESPTFTGSSGSRCERDAPRSPSTAPMSLSDTSGYFGRDREKERDRDKEEIRELKDRHGTEEAALLGALSNFQRTLRLLLCNGNTMNFNENVLVCAERAHPCHSDRHLSCGLLGLPRADSSLRTAVPKLANSSPLVTDVTPFYYEEQYNDTIIIHDSINDDRPDSRQQLRFTEEHDGHDPSPLDDLLPSSTSTPSAHRRLSNTSSIFPAPPANMAMLLADEGLTLSNWSSADQFHFQSGSATAASSKPVSTPISPTTAEFSMVTGSPRSLFLWPEHEQLLGDMGSLDLGTIPD